MTAYDSPLLAHLARIAALLEGGSTTRPVETDDTVGRVATGFGLTEFERDIVLLCAGVELDPAIAAACGDAATFAVALTALPGAHWSALDPNGPLRRWGLVHLGEGAHLLHRPLVIDERVLHALFGLPGPDERLAGLVTPVAGAGSLGEAQWAAVERIVAAWEDFGSAPVVRLDGAPADVHTVAAAAADQVGHPLRALAAPTVPADPTERDRLARLLEREAILDGALLLVHGDTDDPAACRRAASLAASMLAPALVAGVGLPDGDRAAVTIAVPPSETRERAGEWRLALGQAARDLNGAVEDVAYTFRLSGRALRDAANDALVGVAAGEPLSTGLPAAARRRAREGLDGLAERIETVADWDDLVLPEAQRGTLRQIAAHARRRRVVHELWGFADRFGRGLAVTALLSGGSGTGKTMAAEVLARDLGLDLYRIDLAMTVSKYIGETEKNLRRVFDAAEAASAVLLFDEADALFGKRSEVHDAHDRHANIEVSYLLQRTETYRGLAILTTNLPGHLDAAFHRRLRYWVDFPFPDAVARREIWRRVFPSPTPTERLDFDLLAGLNMNGGTIRNVALGAAVLAAENGSPVTMDLLLQATRREYAKVGKPLSTTETRGWPIEVSA